MKLKKIIKFGDIQIQTQKFHPHKWPISIKNIHSNKIVVSNKVSFEYFIGYKNAKKLDLKLLFSQKWVHIRETLMKLNIVFFNKRWFIRKNNEIWEKVKDTINKEFDSDPIYNK